MNARMPMTGHESGSETAQHIAVVGSGVSGLGAAWLLSQRHRVTLLEAQTRAGGHSHTVDVNRADGCSVPVDTGFIVYNEATYPNLTALLAHLDVPTRETQMSFAVSLDHGALEYSGTDLGGLFAQRRRLVDPRFWRMLQDLVRFYRHAPADAARLGRMTLDEYLGDRGYSSAFRQDHLYPMAAAIWSTPAAEIGRYPFDAFVRFCANHNLLKLTGRPPWRTVIGGSREYVRRIARALGSAVRLDSRVTRVERDDWGVRLHTDAGVLPERFDQVVIAAHADEALQLLDSPSPSERQLLGAFRYTQNRVLLHRDPGLMPRRQRVWSSWNYLGERDGTTPPCVSYWMNALQELPADDPLFVTLNPPHEPQPGRVIREFSYAHPLFDQAALDAQTQLWNLQGRRRTWFCGAYFGSGFHEDGLQAGLAVAEAIGGVRRPWAVADESGRIHLARQAGVPA